MKITPILDTRTKRASGVYPIFIRVNANGKTKFVPTGFRITPEQWNGQAVKRTHHSADLINATISDKVAELTRQFAEAQLDRKPFEVLAGEVKKPVSFLDFLQQQMVAYEKRNMIYKAKRISRMVDEVRLIHGKLYIQDINNTTASRLDEFFLECKNNPNTRHKKIKTYREQFKAFIKANKLVIDNPFDDYKVKQKRVIKEKLTPGDIQALMAIELNGWEDLARDIFLFQFFCKGQRIGVVIYSRWSQVKDGRIYFVQAKGTEPVSVKIHPALQQILDKYKGNADYIFGLAKREPVDEHEKINTISNYTALCNKMLKKISFKLGLKKKITTHISRHSFAHQLMLNTGSIFVIKDALGHADIRTTQGYTKSLMDNSIDIEVDKVYEKL